MAFSILLILKVSKWFRNIVDLHSHDFSKIEQLSQKYLLRIFLYGHLRPSFCSFWGIQGPGLIVSVAAGRAWQFWASGVRELHVDLRVSNVIS